MRKIIAYIIPFVFLISPLSAYAALTTNLVGYWKLDESSGNAADSSGNSNTLTNLNTVTYTPEKINNGALFVRLTSQALSIANASQTGLGLTGDFSIGFWINPVSLASNEALVAKWDDHITNSNLSYLVQTDVNGSLNVRLRKDASTDLASVTKNGVLSTGSLQYILVTWTKSSGTVEIWKNGISQGTGTGTSGTNIQSGAASFDLGGTVGLNGSYLNGALDEVGVWSRVLTSTEIGQLYNGGAGLQYPFSALATAGTVNVLVVAGGGAGGNSGGGGGGGAGGVVNSTSFTIATGTYAVTVGDGGGTNSPGNNSVFSTLTALGGGNGGIFSAPTGVNGGSAGGAGFDGTLHTTTGGTATQPGSGSGGLGNNGGKGQGDATNLTRASGGGGGADSVGTDGITAAAGNGGNGHDYSASFGTTYGVSGVFAGGGAGWRNNGIGSGTANGGGGTADVAGTANTGGGGGGCNGAGGGSGVVLVMYPTADAGNYTCGGSTSTFGSNTICAFTANGNFTYTAASTLKPSILGLVRSFWF
jgi:hypothetical protein